MHRKRVKKEARLVDSSAPLFQSMREKSQRIVGETSERSSGVWSKSVFARVWTKQGDQGLWLLLLASWAGEIEIDQGQRGINTPLRASPPSPLLLYTFYRGTSGPFSSPSSQLHPTRFSRLSCTTPSLVCSGFAPDT